MLKTFDIIMIMVMVSAAAVTYRIKATSEEQLRQVHKLERQIANEEDSIDLLKADWSLLTQPSRIEKLVKAHDSELGLVATDSRQVTDLSAVPEKGLGAPAGDPIADAINADGKVADTKVATDKKSKKDKKKPALESEPTSIDDVIETGGIEQ